MICLLFPSTHSRWIVSVPVKVWGSVAGSWHLLHGFCALPRYPNAVCVTACKEGVGKVTPVPCQLCSDVMQEWPLSTSCLKSGAGHCGHRRTLVLFQVLPASQSLSTIAAMAVSVTAVPFLVFWGTPGYFPAVLQHAATTGSGLGLWSESRAREVFVQLLTLVHCPSSLSWMPSTSFPKMHCIPWPFCNGPAIPSRM